MGEKRHGIGGTTRGDNCGNVILLFWALLATFVLSGCSSTFSVGRAVDVASYFVGESFQRAWHGMEAGELVLRTRYNPCGCDEALEYEVHLFGQWRYVRVVGKKESLETLRNFAKRRPKGASFEMEFTLTHSLYTSPSGQEFYTIVLAGSSNSYLEG